MRLSLRSLRLLSIAIVFSGVGAAKLQAGTHTSSEAMHACIFCANYCANLEVFCASQICALDNHRCIATGACEGEDHVIYSTVNVCNEAEL